MEEDDNSLSPSRVKWTRMSSQRIKDAQDLALARIDDEVDKILNLPVSPIPKQREHAPVIGGHYPSRRPHVSDTNRIAAKHDEGIEEGDARKLNENLIPNSRLLEAKKRNQHLNAQLQVGKYTNYRCGLYLLLTTFIS